MTTDRLKQHLYVYLLALNAKSSLFIASLIDMQPRKYKASHIARECANCIIAFYY